MTLDELKQDIKTNKFKNLYLFYGPEEYLKNQYLELIEKKVVDGDFKSLNKIVYDGKIDQDQVIDACDTFPMFSERKLVIFKNTELFSKKPKIKFEKLLEYLGNIPDYTHIVFCEKEIDKRLKSLSPIKKYGMLVEFPYQKPYDLVKWIANILGKRSKQIDNYTASKLIEYCDYSMSGIVNEVEKLLLYVGENSRICTDDIEKVCTKSIKTRVFDLIDAIAVQNIDRAYKVLNDLIASKEPIQRIFYMLAKQFMQILEIKLAMEDGLNKNEAASEMGITSYAAEKLCKQAKEFKNLNLKEVINDILEFDVNIKTGKINDRIAIELIIAKISC